MMMIVLVVLACYLAMCFASPMPSGIIVTTMIEKQVSVDRDTWGWYIVKQSVDPDTARTPSQFVKLQQLLPG